MYRAKEDGRATFCLYEPAMDVRITERPLLRPAGPALDGRGFQGASLLIQIVGEGAQPLGCLVVRGPPTYPNRLAPHRTYEADQFGSDVRSAMRHQSPRFCFARSLLQTRIDRGRVMMRAIAG